MAATGMKTPAKTPIMMPNVAPVPRPPSSFFLRDESCPTDAELAAAALGVSDVAEAVGAEDLEAVDDDAEEEDDDAAASEVGLHVWGCFPD